MTTSDPATRRDELATPPTTTPDSEMWSLALRAAIIVAFTAGCTAAVVTGWRSPARVVFTLGFLLFCPGLAVAEALRIRDLTERLVIAIGGSLALDTLLALLLIYVGAFSARLAVVILAAVTLATLGGALARSFSRSRRAQPPGLVQ